MKSEIRGVLRRGCASENTLSFPSVLQSWRRLLATVPGNSPAYLSSISDTVLRLAPSLVHQLFLFREWLREVYFRTIHLRPKFGRSVEYLIIAKGLAQGVNCRRELADVAVLPPEQHQDVHEMEDGQISELLFAEVPILREASGDFFVNRGVVHGFLSAYLPGFRRSHRFPRCEATVAGGLRSTALLIQQHYDISIDRGSHEPIAPCSAPPPSITSGWPTIHFLCACPRRSRVVLSVTSREPGQALGLQHLVENADRVASDNFGQISFGQTLGP